MPWRRYLSRLDPARLQQRGRVHAIETCGTVDGPGIRTVIFLQGCRLSCRFCHNPDSWSPQGGREVSVEDLLREVVAYRPYHRSSGGGVTLSGGDPLAQPAFAIALMESFRGMGVHTALDTSGGRPLDISQPVLQAADLVLLDIKHTDAAQHQWLCGVPLEHSLATANHLAAINKPVWIRHVVIPGISDNDEHLQRLADLIAGWPNVERVDLLAYHTMHLEKWDALGRDNPLEGTAPTDVETMQRAREICLCRGLPVS